MLKESLIVLSVMGLLILTSCGNKGDQAEINESSNFQYFGDSISGEGAISATQLQEKLGSNDSLHIKVSGRIEEVCQKKGCWMMMEVGNGKLMRVRFKDYEFFVPKDAAGSTMIIEGVAFQDTTSVELLRHYAEDAGDTKEEILKITKPEINIGFEAHGVVLKP